MSAQPLAFAALKSGLVPLQVAPRLASWMAADHPDQAKVEEFLAHAVHLVGADLAQLPDPLALRLDVGLPSKVELLNEHDLDNYLFPLAMRLSLSSGRQFATAWATKERAETSFIGVGQAVRVAPAPPSGDWIRVRTTASSGSSAYKQQIHDQLQGVEALPAGPVSLELSFTVGPTRNWLNLWKPTIDALDSILGASKPGLQWHPRDGRIVELGLHRHVDPTLGNDVSIALSATHR